MKRILSLFSVVVVMATGIFITRHYMTGSEVATPLVEVYQPDWLPDTEGYEEDDIKLSTEFSRRAIANQVTGTIDPSDVIAARRQVLTSMNRTAGARNLNLEWRFMGPDNIGGRSRDILFDRNNPSRALAGGVTGGLWISDDGGLSWRVYEGSDTLAGIGVVSMVQAANGDIYVGTGENPNNNNGGPSGTTNGETGKIGEGIWKSTDGGNTFVQLAATIPSVDNSSSAEFAMIPGLAAHPTDGNVIVAGTNSGALITRDGGQTWNDLATNSVLTSSFIQDIEVADNGTVHLSANGRYYKGNIDDPSSFPVIPGLFDNKSFRRLMIGLAPSDNNYVYVIGCNAAGATSGVYRSKDGGETWSPIAPAGLPSESFNPTGEQGWFDMEIAVHPSDKNRAYVAGQLAMYAYQYEESTSKNLWWPISTWVFSAVPQFFTQYVHADQHQIRFHPSNPNWMYVTTDGGIHRTKKSAVNYGEVPAFEILNDGFGVTQFYGISAGIDGRVLGGTQDNGTILLDFTLNSGTQGKRVHGGDGFFTDIAKTNPEAMYSGTYFGAITRSATGYSNYGGARYFDENIDEDGDGRPDEGAGFYFPQMLWEEFDQNSPEYGKGIMFIGTNGGIWAGYDALDFGKDPTWFKIASQANGMQTFGGRVFPTNFDMSADGNILYVTTASGELYRIDGLLGVTWEYDDNGSPSNTTDDFFDPAANGITVTRIANYPNRYASSVAVDPNDPEHVVLTLGNYGNTNYVYKSTSAASATGVGSFTSIQGNMPRMPVYSAIIDASNEDNILLGTEMGVYTSSNGGFQWQLDSDGFPLTAVYMLKQERVDDLSKDCYAIYAGTHGRGIFMTQTLTDQACTVPTSVEAPINNTLFQLAPNPAAQLTQVSFSVEKAVDLQLIVYDIMGREVQFKNLGEMPAGQHNVSIDVSQLAVGNYIVVLRSEHQQHSEQIVVAR